MPCRAHIGRFVAALLRRKVIAKNRFPISHTKRLPQQPVNVVQNHEKLAGVDTFQFSLPRTAKIAHVIEFTSFAAIWVNVIREHNRHLCCSPTFAFALDEIAARRTSPIENKSFSVIHERQLAKPRDAAIISRSYVRN